MLDAFDEKKIVKKESKIKKREKHKPDELTIYIFFQIQEEISGFCIEDSFTPLAESVCLVGE